MALRFGFFNSVNGDRKYDARWFAKYFASFIGNGIFPNPSNCLQVMAHENMTVVVKAGQGWINGYYADNDGDYYLTFDNADGLLNRIDRVVLRWNQIDRVIELIIKKGDFATNAVAPALQRDGDYYELILADVLINKGLTQITQAQIVDTRLNSELCGIVHGVVNQVDTTTLFNQYQSWIEQQKQFYETEITQWTATQQAEFEQFQLDVATIFNNAMQQNQQEHNQMISDNQNEFDTWLAAIQAALDGDVAGNLLNLINGVQEEVEAHLTRTDNPHAVTKAQVGLGSVENYGIATQAEAEAGTSTSKYMTPQCTKQAIDKTTGTLSALQTAQKGTLVAAINEVFTNGNNVKRNTVSALLSVDNSLPITQASTWATIINSIGEINTGLSLLPSIPGDLIILESLAQNPASSYSTARSYQKLKEIRVGFEGVIRVKFRLISNGNGSGSVYGRIYVNGNPVGIERYSYTATYTEDITVNAGDLVQIYAKATSFYDVKISNFTIGIALPEYDYGTVIL